MADEHWWSAPGLLEQAIEQASAPPSTSVAYRLGDAVLRVDTDDPLVLTRFADAYADCAAPEPVPEPRVRCQVRRATRPPLVVLTFRAGAPPDPAGASYCLLRPTHAVPPYTVRDSPVPGWRLAGGAVDPILAASSRHVVIDPLMVPPDFVVEYLVGITLAAQPELLPVHAGAVAVGETGLALIGNSRSGKTTLSLQLAARGHSLLSDEVALVRLGSGEMLPFQRAMNVRPGPHGPELASALGPLPPDGCPWDARWSGSHRITELFPGRPARPARLRAVFFLGGFADRPSLAPFRLALDDSEASNWLETPEIAYASWGLTPERRAFRLLTLRQLLARIPCWRLTVGPPAETARLLEETMEGL